MHAYVHVVRAWRMLCVFHFLLSMCELTNSGAGRTQSRAVVGCVAGVCLRCPNSPLRVPRSAFHAGERPGHFTEGTEGTEEDKTAKCRYVGTVLELPWPIGREVRYPERGGRNLHLCPALSPLPASVHALSPRHHLFHRHKGNRILVLPAASSCPPPFHSPRPTE